ncbi:MULTISPECIES: glycerophosphodiester phosphodiesterase [unclassified Bacillus (in: firmicutes)]|uniref:glycerophosphodiester phosphodiesterase n=1 Tax=unclassified Bacillus (in: firmicutes) TaxID=185979 RepID=UPI0008E7B41B|nr:MULTISPECIES: glycerophosphodiester phosphodiesterase [unclassified Bacillus (in: firmicutes)]SFA96925.1 glycerophosphoryl diester phosphodiesterase [Bacillus sp. UNCCL13]SFQ80146.1 glycerophosphoryl diester phosphodiesterase [Bacillus sp. cl95]
MTKIIAHRGYSALFSENTMTAFVEAEKSGAEGLEIDVQLTKDGELVVIHDEKLDRTTSGTGWVKDFTFAEIRKLNANILFKTQTKKEPIPSLVELLDWIKSTNLILNIELKNGILPYEGMEEKVISLVRAHDLSSRVIISSFNHYSIVKSFRLAPEIETAPLYSEGLYMPWIYAQSIGAKGIHPKYIAANDFIVKSAMENGIAVRPYTVNKESEMRRLINVGCSAFVTDDPVKALKIRKQSEKRPS